MSQSQTLDVGDNDWLVGVGRVEITPDEPIWLHGWGNRDKPSSEVSQAIWAKALAFRDGAGHTAVLVSADILGFSRKQTLELSDWITEKHGLTRDQLILNASHNHSGPVTEDVLPLYFDLPKIDQKVVARYTQQLEAKLKQVIGQALADLSPAKLSWGQGLAGFAVNRRRDRAGCRHLPGVVDHDVPVLKVEDRKGRIRAVAFGYACHTTTISDGTINGDYAGWAQHHLEQMHAGATALFVAGCGADANPLPRFRLGLVELYGQILAHAVDHVLQDQMQPVGGKLLTAFGEADLPFESIPTRASLTKMLPGRSGVRLREIINLIDVLDRGESLPASCQFPIHVWRFTGGPMLIALTGETVVDYALKYKQKYGWESTWVMGYCNELLAYIPSRRVLEEGDYEGGDGMMEYGHPGAFDFSIEDVLDAMVDRLFDQPSSCEVD